MNLSNLMLSKYYPPLKKNGKTFCATNKHKIKWIWFYFLFKKWTRFGPFLSRMHHQPFLNTPPTPRQPPSPAFPDF